jgi:hypothetical protein
MSHCAARFAEAELPALNRGDCDLGLVALRFFDANMCVDVGRLSTYPSPVDATKLLIFLTLSLIISVAAG